MVLVGSPSRSPIGKRVGGAIYLHISAIDDTVRPIVEQAVSQANGFNWNVVKIAAGHLQKPLDRRLIV